jgi:hypothetical protein
VLHAGSGGSGGGGHLWPGCCTSSLGDDRSSHCSGLVGALALSFHTSALSAGAGCSVTQGEELLFLWLVLRRLPVRWGVFVGTRQVVEDRGEDVPWRTLVRGRLRVVAGAFGGTLFAGAEVVLDFNLLVLPRRGVVAH